MKTLAEIQSTLDVFSKRFDFVIGDTRQGSETWLNLKLGVISASRASEAVAKKDSATRLSYMAELVGQVCTGVPEEINSKYLDWGKQNEAAARSTYEFEHGLTIIELPFVFKDESFRIGCSPDGIVSATKGMEIKCPYNTEHYIKFLTMDKSKVEYDWQNQFTMWVMDADEWDFVQFDPRMRASPMKTVTVKKDPEMQAKMSDLIPAFISDMDAMLKKIGVVFGSQWKEGYSAAGSATPVRDCASESSAGGLGQIQHQGESQEDNSGVSQQPGKRTENAGTAPGKSRRRARRTTDAALPESQAGIRILQT